MQSVPITTNVVSSNPVHGGLGVLDTTLSDKVCRWFSLDIPVSSTNTTDRHNITEILLEMVLNPMKPNQLISEN
jgi:hypothetical protein